MKKRISLIAVALMLILYSNVAFATTVNTDYEGMGDFELQTTILSPIAPIITDTVDINTGCDGGCCCCPDCAGDYEGNQIVTNNPFAASGHKTTVTDGCVVIEQYYYDEFNGYTTHTDYYTYFNGTGTAESYVYAVPGEGMSYQLANGTGSAFVSFDQVVFLNDVFDYGTSYGGGTWICSPGYAGLMNGYYLDNGEMHYDSELGLYCIPASESSLYTFLFAKSTDYFDLSSSFAMGPVEYYQNVGVEGSSDYGFVVEADPSEFDDIDFNFEMDLG